MTHVKPHLVRFAAFFLVGALVMAPLSASAAPSVTVSDNSLAADGNGNSGNGGNPGNGNNGNDGENGNSGGEAPGNSSNSGNPGNGNNGNDGENGNSGGEAPGNSNRGNAGNNGNADPAGVAAGLGAAPPSLTPSGVTPTQGGLGSIDARILPAHLGAAIVIFDQNHETLTSVPEPVTPPIGLGMISEKLVRELAPVLPPLLIDVVAAPFVVVEALIDAMASSGQALVIPFLAGAAGLMAPGVRRKNLLAEALGQNHDSDS